MTKIKVRNYEAGSGSSNLLCGSVTATGTLISIPSGATWVGTIAVSSEAATAIAVTTANTAGVFPQNTIVAAVDAAARSNVTPNIIVINDTTSAVAVTATFTGTTGRVTANGVLI